MSRSVSAPSSVTKTSPCWYGDIVPGSTLRYGSSFMVQTLAPRLLSNRPIEAVVMPLPTDETTPPVTKMYFGMLPSLLLAVSCQPSAISCPSPSATHYQNESPHSPWRATAGPVSTCSNESRRAGRLASSAVAALRRWAGGG